MSDDFLSDVAAEAMAPATGPFPHLPFLTAWHEELGGDYAVFTAEWPHGGVMMMRSSASGIELLGEPDLTDYHSPLGQLSAADLLGWAKALPRDRMRLDSLPIEAAEPLETALKAAGRAPRVAVHEYALRVELPATRNDFDAMLSKRDRHELRRKRRRYEDLVGKVALRTEQGEGDAFSEFIRLHRLAAGPKGEFMSGPRERFFRRLAAQPGWRVDLLETTSGAAAACLFGFSDGIGYYLYNSSFDPAFAPASPGLVVLTEMIDHVISQGHQIFDFLKGDEDYKTRLGAGRRPLYVIEVDA